MILWMEVGGICFNHTGRKTSEKSFFVSQTNISDFSGGFSCLSQFNIHSRPNEKSHFYILSFLLLFFIHICCHFQSVKVNSMQKKATEKKKLIQDVCLLFDGFLGNVTVNVTKFRTTYWNKWIEWEGETKREKDENTR